MSAQPHTLDPSTWIERYGNELFRYAIQRLRNEEDAEDVVQDTFLTAWRTRNSYRGDLSERNWLYTILKSRMIDLIRRRATRQNVFVEQGEIEDDTFREDGHWAQEAPSSAWTSDSLDVAERADFQEIFDRCLRQLPEQQRLIFVAREIDGLETEEICQLFNVSASNLWVILHRARLRLRECLKTHWFEGQQENS